MKGDSGSLENASHAGFLDKMGLGCTWASQILAITAYILRFMLRSMQLALNLNMPNCSRLRQFLVRASRRTLSSATFRPWDF